MLGLPDEDARNWIAAVARMLDPVIDDDEHARCNALMDEMYAYLEHQIEAKRRTPGDDVLTALVQAEEDGDRLSRRARGPGGHAVRGGARADDVADRQRAAGAAAPTRPAGAVAVAPDLLPNGVNELLRYDGPNQFVRRIAVSRTIDGTTIAPGDVVYAAVGAANATPPGGTTPTPSTSTGPMRPTTCSSVRASTAASGPTWPASRPRWRSALVFRLDELALAGEPQWSERMVIRGLQRAGHLPGGAAA